jgi:hypothetical protein
MNWEHIKETYNKEMTDHRNKSCIDLIEVIRRNIREPIVADGNIGINRRHQSMNWLTGRRYWTGCAELREFIGTVSESVAPINSEYVGFYHRDSSGLHNYTEQRHFK